MSRAISDTQKKAIYTDLPSSVTIGATTITASKIWANQAITSYPTISLNVSTDGIPAVRDVSDGVIYYKTILTIHILTKNQSSLNCARIADAFAGSICTELESWATTPSPAMFVFMMLILILKVLVIWGTTSRFTITLFPFHYTILRRN